MKREQKQIFLFTLGLSLFLMLSAAGLVAVDSACRRLSFGDPRPAFQRVELPDAGTGLEILLFGREKVVDITKIDQFFIFLLDFSCIPHN